jgi:hypothetical protein
VGFRESLREPIQDSPRLFKVTPKLICHFVGLAKHFQQFSLGFLEQLQVLAERFHQTGELGQVGWVHAQILTGSENPWRPADWGTDLSGPSSQPKLRWE